MSRSEREAFADIVHANRKQREALARLRDPNRNELDWSCVRSGECLPDLHTLEVPCELEGLA